MRILFIVKKQRFGYSGGGPSSGLYNSAKFVVDMLRNIDVHAKLVLVTDNNDIDREVNQFRPRIVIIEALWVEPNKFHHLVKLHPSVKWVVRNHSAMPFLAHEGMALDWIFRYLERRHVEVGCNDGHTRREIQVLANARGIEKHISYLPNYYPPFFHPRHHNPSLMRVVNVACFGAIRPLKNQLMQAVAAICYGERVGKSIHFHINTERVECDGEPILRNIRALFRNEPRHKLIEHPWLEREQFIALVRTMDLGMQVSFSETFNIITADFVMNSVPVVVSRQISWVSDHFWAIPTDSLDIAHKIERAVHHHNDDSVHSLQLRDAEAVLAWEQFIDRHRQ